MTEEARRTILKLKHLKRTRHFSALSYEIYRAMLLGGAKEPEEVAAWLACQSAAQQSG
jgi:hypothetical protein